MHELLVVIAAFAAALLLEARPPVASDEAPSLTSVEASLEAAEFVDAEPPEPLDV